MELWHGPLLNKDLFGPATFLGRLCSWIMKTFLKIFLILVLALLAVKLLPAMAVCAFAGLMVAAILGALGVTLVAILLMVGIALAMALSPIWIPVLLVMGIFSLIRKLAGKPAAPPAIAS